MATKAVKKRTAAKKRSAKKRSSARKTSSRKTTPRKAAPKRSAKKAAKKSPRKWSRRVNETSDALDLRPNVFKSKDPKKVAASLKRSAERSKRRKTTPFQSAMSMLNFYVNRGGKNLSPSEKKVLEKAKNELRKLYDRPEK